MLDFNAEFAPRVNSIELLETNEVRREEALELRTRRETSAGLLGLESEAFLEERETEKGLAVDAVEAMDSGTGSDRVEMEEEEERLRRVE